MTDAQDKAVAGAVLNWWRLLHPDENGKGGDRGAAARLRRSATPTEALLVREAVMLHGALRDAYCKSLTEAQSVAVGTLAVILATVKPGKRSFLPFATALGRPPGGLRPGDGEAAVMSGLRFGALMRATEAGERYRHLRRAVDLLGNTPFDVVGFADDLMGWNDARRRRWIFEYYQAGASAPDETKI